MHHPCSGGPIPSHVKVNVDVAVLMPHLPFLLRLIRTRQSLLKHEVVHVQRLNHHRSRVILLFIALIMLNHARLKREYELWVHDQILVKIECLRRFFDLVFVTHQIVGFLRHHL